ncbi:hypothetical protein GJ496_006931 [Pomphorhynchus laevis]|nr:hypothetical protein GJ496_006931 [Pomphorhynchus laevis]
MFGILKHAFLRETAAASSVSLCSKAEALQRNDEMCVNQELDLQIKNDLKQCLDPLLPAPESKASLSSEFTKRHYADENIRPDDKDSDKKEITHLRDPEINQIDIICGNTLNKNIMSVLDDQVTGSSVNKTLSSEVLDEFSFPASTTDLSCNECVQYSTNTTDVVLKVASDSTLLSSSIDDYAEPCRQTCELHSRIMNLKLKSESNKQLQSDDQSDNVTSTLSNIDKDLKQHYLQSFDHGIQIDVIDDIIKSTIYESEREIEIDRHFVRFWQHNLENASNTVRQLIEIIQKRQNPF